MRRSTRTAAAEAASKISDTFRPRKRARREPTPPPTSNNNNNQQVAQAPPLSNNNSQQGVQTSNDSQQDAHAPAPTSNGTQDGAQVPEDVEMPHAVEPPADIEVPKDAETPSDDEDLEEWDKVKFLAEAETNLPCTYRGDDNKEVSGRIRAELRIHPDAECKSRLGYCVRFHKTDTGSEEEQIVAYIDAWRIDKPTPTRPDRAAFVAELINPRYDRIDAAKSETALCMKSIFTKQGTLKRPFQNREGELGEDKLIFIQMIRILPQFQRKRLLGPVLSAFNDVLGNDTLPEWYVFDGTLVLVPARPDSSGGDSWGDMKDDQVESKLVGVYKQHGYSVWGQEVKVDGFQVTVMGRKIPDAATHSDSGEESKEGGNEDGVASRGVGKRA